MCSKGYGTWSMCLCVCVCVTFSTTVCYNVHNKTYHRLQQDIRKILNLLCSGIMAIFAFSTKAAIFLALSSMHIPTCGHVGCFYCGLNTTFDFYWWYIGLLLSIMQCNIIL